MKIFLNLTKRELAKTRYTRAIDDYIRRTHLAGLRAFVNAANVKVPVFTGQARATFVPLAKLVGTQVIINPRAVRKDRSPATGAAKQIFKLIGSKFDYRLKFDLTDPSLQYYDFLDNNPGRSPTSPWDSFEAGRQAYKKVTKERLAKGKIPKVKNFVVFTRIKLNG